MLVVESEGAEKSEEEPFLAPKHEILGAGPFPEQIPADETAGGGLDEDELLKLAFFHPLQLLHKLSGSLIHEQRESSSNRSESSNEKRSLSTNSQSRIALSRAAN